MLRTRHFVKTNGDTGMFKLSLHVLWVETLESYMCMVVIVPGDSETHGMELSYVVSSNEPLETGDDETVNPYVKVTQDAIDQLCEDMEDYGDDEANISEWRMRNSITENDFAFGGWVRYDGDGQIGNFVLLTDPNEMEGE